MGIYIVDQFRASDLQGSPSEASTPARPNRNAYFNKSARRSLVQELRERRGEHAEPVNHRG